MFDSEPPLTPISDPAKPDGEAVERHRHGAGQLGAEIPAIAGEQKLGRDECRDQDEGDLEDRCRRKRRDHRAAADADDGRQRPEPDHFRHHQTLLAVREIGAHRRRQDDGDRGADAKLHAHRLRHVEHAKHFVEHRHDDGAAADAEQPGKNP